MKIRRNPLTSIMITLVVLYQKLVSPWLPRRCRFEPSCSEYALESLRRHGSLKGAWFGLRRLSRCHPFHVGGYDPVPTVSTRRKERVTSLG